MGFPVYEYIYHNLNKHYYNQYYNNVNQYEYIYHNLDFYQYVNIYNNNTMSIVKQTFATPGYWKPATANEGKQLAGPCEVSVLKLTAGSSAAHVTIYDSSTSTTNPNKIVWVLDASTQDDDCQVFTNPLVFKNGVYAVCDQGSTFNAEICIARVE